MSQQKVVNIEVGQAVKSLSDLRKEISTLKSQMFEMDEASEEYQVALQKLTYDQEELSSFMVKTSKNAGALEGSYNALQHQLSTLRQEWKTTSDEARRNELAEQMNTINDKLKEMDASIGNFQRNVGNYEGALQNYGESLNVLGVKGFGAVKDGMEQVKGAANMLVKHPIIALVAVVTAAIMKLVDAIKSNEVASQNLQRALAPVQGILNAVSNVVAKLVEYLTEGLLSVMNKLTDATTEALRWLQKVADALGLEGIGGAIADLNNHIKESVEIEEESVELLKLQRKYRRLNADDQIELTRLQTEFKKAEGDITKQRLIAQQIGEKERAMKERAVELAQREYDLILKKNKQSGNSSEDNEKAEEAYEKLQEAKARLNELSQEEEELISKNAEAASKANEQRLRELAEIEKARKAQLTKEEEDIINEQELMHTRLKESIKEMSYLAESQERAALKAIEDLNTQMEKSDAGTFEKRRLQWEALSKTAKVAVDETTNTLSKMQKEYDGLTEIMVYLEESIQKIGDRDPEFVNALQENIDELRGRMEDLTRAMDEQVIKLNEVIEAYDEYGEGSRESMNYIVETWRQAMTEQASIMNEFATNIASIGDGISSQWAQVFTTFSGGINQVAHSLTTSEKGFKKWSGVASTAIAGVSSMFMALADEQDTSTKEGFEQQKKYQASAAVMSTLAGIVAAWASAMQLPFPANVAVGASLSTMMTAMGAVQVAKIKSAKFGGGELGDSNGGSATPAANAVQYTMQAPVQYTQEVANSTTESEIGQEQQLFVSVVDINSTQESVKTTQALSTF